MENPVSKSLDWFSYLQARSAQSSAIFVESIMTSETLVFSDKPKLRAWLCESGLKHRPPGLSLEFGARMGKSSVQFAEAVGPLFVFDSFEGLRDPWSKPDRPPGAMDLGGNVPDKLLSHPEIRVVKGWVEDTLDPFLLTEPDPVSFIHFDLDAYRPTVFSMKKVVDRLAQGALVLVDDLYGFVGWQNHSARALKESLNEKQLSAVAVGGGAAAFRYVR